MTLLNSGHDFILLLFAQERMYGQADDFAGSFFRFREVAQFVAATCENGLLMQALGIIDGGRDSFGTSLVPP